MNQFSVNEAQIIQGMGYYERLAGPRDRVTICREVSELADLLMDMRWSGQSVAELPDTARAYVLLTGAGIQLQAVSATDMPFSPDGTSIEEEPEPSDLDVPSC